MENYLKGFSFFNVNTVNKSFALQENEKLNWANMCVSFSQIQEEEEWRSKYLGNLV